MRKTSVRGLLGILVSSTIASGLNGCKSDGTPDFTFTPPQDPLSILAPLVLRGLAPFVAEKDPIRGAALYNAGDELGRQRAARAGRSEVNVYQNETNSSTALGSNKEGVWFGPFYDPKRNQNYDVWVPRGKENVPMGQLTHRYRTD